MGESFSEKVTGSEANEHANQQFSDFSCFATVRENGVEPVSAGEGRASSSVWTTEASRPVNQRPKLSTCQRPKLSSLATFSSTALMMSRMASANFINNVHVKHSRYLRQKCRIVTQWGGNFWTLFPP